MPLNAKNENWEFHKRFFLKVKIGKPNDCWPFVAGKLKSGYGQLHVGKKNIRAHRFAWSLANGDLADDLVVCHKCDNKECCNPNHLFVGTQKDNMADYSQKVQSGRAKRKPNGPNLKGEKHPMSRLKPDDILEIRRRVLDGVSRKKIASDFNITVCHVTDIHRRGCWKHI